jgi:hypothetical protein
MDKSTGGSSVDPQVAGSSPARGASIYKSLESNDHPTYFIGLDPKSLLNKQGIELIWHGHRVGYHREPFFSASILDVGLPA